MVSIFVDDTMLCSITASRLGHTHCLGMHLANEVQGG